jgi:hypothetical protein
MRHTLASLVLLGVALLPPALPAQQVAYASTAVAELDSATLIRSGAARLI